MKSILRLLIISLVLACGSDERKKSEDPYLFKYNESQGITSLDPAYARNIENISAVNLIFNGLVQMDENMDITPCIASDWEISKNGKVYTFFLRRDVYFHDHFSFTGKKGRKVTAKDFVYSFQRIMHSKTASPGAWIFSNINVDTLSLGMEAMDKYTLRICLNEPFQPFLGLLSMKYCSVIPHEVVEHYGDDFRVNPVGTGPFKFKTWVEGNKLVLLKNENYFELDADGKSLPYLQAVSISFVNDEEVEYLEFLKGNLDYVDGTNESNREFLDNTGEIKEKYAGQFNVLNNAFLNTEYLGFLMDSSERVMIKSPINDKLVRLAMNLSIDRKSMVKYLKSGIGTPAEEGFIPEGLPPYRKGWVKGYEYNPDSARKLLEIAGYPAGEGLEEIPLFTTAQYLTLCEYIQSQWSEIGIKVRIELNPAATTRELVAISKAPFFRKSWVADYPDAENYLALFYSPNKIPFGPNYTLFENALYDKLYEQSRVALSDSLRYSLYKRMEEIILSESPVVPLYYDRQVRYVQPDVIGFKSNPMGLIELKKVKKQLN